MDGQSLDVLAENNLWSVVVADTNYVLKERTSVKSLVVVIEALTFSCQTNIKGRNILFFYFCNVSGYFRTILGEIPNSRNLRFILIPPPEL